MSSNRGKRKRDSYGVRNLFKIVVIGVLLLVMLSVKLRLEEKEKVNQVTQYRESDIRDAYKALDEEVTDYRGIFFNLKYYDFSDAKYDRYREVLNGYIDYSLYVSWCKASEAGYPDTMGKKPDLLQSMKENEECCMYEPNRKYLQQFLEQAYQVGK